MDTVNTKTYSSFHLIYFLRFSALDYMEELSEKINLNSLSGDIYDELIALIL
jgi:hypothetical protein